jgi:two-component system response regulator CpxR
MVETTNGAEKPLVAFIGSFADINHVLEGAGYAVCSFQTPGDALAADPDSVNPAVTVLYSQSLPQEARVEMVGALRKKWPFAPLLAMVGADEVQFASDFLVAGACDYSSATDGPESLIQRLATRIQEFAKRSSNDTFSLGDIKVDAGHRLIYRDDRKRALSPTEMNLLHCLATAGGTIVNRDVMKRRCWGQADVSDNALNRKLHEVRRALSSLTAQVSIKTIYGTGFLLEVKSS